MARRSQDTVSKLWNEEVIVPSFDFVTLASLECFAHKRLLISVCLLEWMNEGTWPHWVFEIESVNEGLWLESVSIYPNLPSSIYSKYQLLLRSLGHWADILSRSSIYTGSASVNSTNCRSKKYFKRNSRKFQKQNLNLLHTGNYLYGTYIILGIVSILEMI